jgi:hypothetical protein
MATTGRAIKVVAAMWWPCSGREQVAGFRVTVDRRSMVTREQATAERMALALAEEEWALADALLRAEEERGFCAEPARERLLLLRRHGWRVELPKAAPPTPAKPRTAPCADPACPHVAMQPHAHEVGL